MAGGTWLSQNKVRPGAYINFKAVDRSAMTVGERGVVAMALPLDWGKEAAVTVVLSSDLQDGSSMNTIGFDASDLARSKYLRAALSYAYKALVFNTRSGGKNASLTMDDVTVTARYPGEMGNKIMVSVEVATNGVQTVYTYVNGTTQDKQQVMQISELSDNDWVTFEYAEASKGKPLSAAAGKQLSGGENGDELEGDAQMIAAFKKEKWQTLAYPGKDEAAKKNILTAIQGMREDEGTYVQAVMADYDADYEGIINVANGVVIDGESFDANEAVYIVAGMTAGADCNQSNTAKKIVGATEIIGDMTDSEIKDALNSGKFLFSTATDGSIKVEKDINSLHTFPQNRDYSYSKNRVIRVLDEIGTQTKITWENSYMGKVDNNDTGRSLLKADLAQYANELQRISAIQNFDAASDINVRQGNNLDSVLVDWRVMPVDSMEILYLEVSTRTSE